MQFIHDLYQKIAKWAHGFQSPKAEGVKQIIRLAFFFVVSWILTETAKQLNFIPEFYTIKVLVFVYMIPVRTSVALALTAIQTFIDKYKFEKSKSNIKAGEAPVGIFPA